MKRGRLMIEVRKKRGINMKIVVDSDACPVKNIIVEETKKRGIEVIMVCDTSHIIRDGYSRVVTVSQGADSADIALINLTRPGDLVITQDYGVAAMALGKGASALSQNGMVYDGGNMDQLLFERFLGKKVRRAGGRTKGPKKRTAEQDEAFRRQLVKLLKDSETGNS